MEIKGRVKEVLEALCEAAEGESRGEWRDVYIDNARAKIKDMSPYTFAGYLGALEKAGYYKPIDRYAWGEVRDEAFQVIP